MNTIVTLTLNPAVDKATSVANVVSEDKLRCKAPHFHPGGGGINVARAIQRLGGSALALFPAGGPPGRMLSELLAAEQLPTRPIEIAAWTRENLAVFEESSGRQYRFNLPGATLARAELDRCLAAIADVEELDYVVFSGSLPAGVDPGSVREIAAAVEARGARLVLDSSGPALREALDNRVYLIKPNAREFTELAGNEAQDERAQKRAARELVARCACEVLVVSLGAAGALVATAERAWYVRSPSVPIRSKVGAGDSMVGALVLALQRGQSLDEAVTFGVAAGAAAVMTPGSELCRRDDVERLYASLRTPE